MPPVSLKRLTWIFVRVGNLTFGGGDPTMAALQSELVVTRALAERGAVRADLRAGSNYAGNESGGFLRGGCVADPGVAGRDFSRWSP